MGNDVSTTSARTLIPLDDSVCWKLYNGINERSEPISIFISKQTYSVECRRSIQFLKTIRHPNIIKFYNDFKTFVDHDSFIGDCVHPLANKLNNYQDDLTAKLSLGLYQLTQALEFLHDKAFISHNNVCLLSIYVSLNGIWKLGNFECASKYDQLNKKYLSSLKLIRSEECITPQEDEKNSEEFDKKDMYAIDVYGFGTLIRNLLTIVNVDESLRSVLNELEVNLTEEEPQARPTWSKLLRTQLFQIDYIKATELLDRLPTIDESDLPNAVDCLSTYLDNLNEEHINELLIRRLFVPFMFLCSSTRLKLIPKILIPKDNHNNINSLISIEKYRTYVTPLLIDLFSYHVTCIRETLLEYFNSYWQLIDKNTLINIILPQLIFGLKDSNNTICTLTLIALASMVPVLGAEIVVGGQRRQIFTDKMKKENVVFSRTSKAASRKNSPISTTPPPSRTRNTSPIPTTTNSSLLTPLPPSPPPPQRTRKMSSSERNKTKSLRLKQSSAVKTTSVTNEIPPPPPPPVSPEYTNGYHLPSDDFLEEPKTTIVQNGVTDHHAEDEIDNDDGQWSDWEHNSDPFDSPADYVPSPPPEETLKSTISTLPVKSLKLTNTSKSKWDPNAPLGSEYEISPIVLTKKKETKVEPTVNQDADDFFKDMTPKVETVELMRQLETMFNVSTDQPEEQIKSTIKKTTTTSQSFSNKFGITSSDHDDKQEIESGSNWDE